MIEYRGSTDVSIDGFVPEAVFAYHFLSTNCYETYIGIEIRVDDFTGAVVP